MRSNRSKHGPCVDVRAWLSPSPGMAFEPGTQVRGHLPRYTKVMLQWSVILIPDQLCTALPLPRASPLGPWGPCGLGFPSFVGSPGSGEGVTGWWPLGRACSLFRQFQCIWERNAGRRRGLKMVISPPKVIHVARVPAMAP